MIFTNKLAKTLAGIALTFAFTTSANAGLVEWTFQNTTFANDTLSATVTGSFTVDDAATVTAGRGATKTTYTGLITSSNILLSFNDGSSYTLGLADNLSGTFNNGLSAYDVNRSSLNLGRSFISSTGTVDLINFNLANNNSVVLTEGGVYSASGLQYLSLKSGSITTNPTATAVPEPEAYAMMLAGLGLVGFAARRKQKAV